jgi:CBS domain-containing membrane protein
MKKPAYPYTGSKPHGRSRLFMPILAGATLRERIIGCLGALIGIALTGLICSRLSDNGSYLPLIVAPIGASAVLLFAVPASPLAQPWPIIGGNTISALVGVAVAHVVQDQALAIGAGVALAIAAMSFTRCLHPPGGAAALTAVLGGPIVTNSGFLFPFVPVALNSLVLVALGILFHRLSRRSYPHVPAPAPVNTHHTLDPPPQTRVGFRSEDVDAALEALDETFDIDRDDLDRLLRQVELQALVRSHGILRCRDIMSRDVVRISLEETTITARTLLLAHNIRTLPVVNEKNTLLGTVGLRELANTPDRIVHLLSQAATASPDDPALELLPVLTNGHTHAVIIVDEQRCILGLITQTDLLAATARSLAGNALPNDDKERRDQRATAAVD